MIIIQWPGDDLVINLLSTICSLSAIQSLPKTFLGAMYVSAYIDLQSPFWKATQINPRFCNRSRPGENWKLFSIYFSLVTIIRPSTGKKEIKAAAQNCELRFFFELSFPVLELDRPIETSLTQQFISVFTSKAKRFCSVRIIPITG